MTGGGLEPPPPHPATKHSTASMASGRSVRRRRGDAALAGMTNQIASITNSASSGEPSGAKVIFVARSRANSGTMSDDAEDEEAIGGKDTAAERTAPAVRAVVVTVNVVPLMVQVPSGIEQLAVSVGGAVNPLVVIGKVKAVPADPIWVGCDGVTIGAAVNVAVAVVFAVMVKAHAAVVLPAHAPAQLVNVAPVFGTAVKVIDVPDAKLVPVGAC